MLKVLPNCALYVIIIKRDCNRYAMKQKVAGGMPGNFCGVCPILNRATEIPNTVSDIFGLIKKLEVCNCVLMTVTRTHKSVGIFLLLQTGNARVRAVFHIRPPKINPRRRKKWQSTKRSESRSRVMNTQR